MHEIRFHNTLGGKIEAFAPQKGDGVRMYTCGPTVYDYAHIGNYRTFVFQDILRRFLKLRGFKMKHVMNLTDVDDRIIANSAAAGVSIRDYTEKYAQAFFTIARRSASNRPSIGSARPIISTIWSGSLSDCRRRPTPIQAKVRSTTASRSFRITAGSRTSMSQEFRPARGSMWTATRKRARATLPCGKRQSLASISGRLPSAKAAPAGTLNSLRWP